MENSFAGYWIERQILICKYKEGTRINRQAAERIVADRLKLHQGKSYPILCDLRGIHQVDKAARDYLAIEGSILVTAVAFVVDPVITKAISQFYIKASNPPVPVKNFMDYQSAKAYLVNYL